MKQILSLNLLIFTFLLGITEVRATCSPMSVSMSSGGAGATATAFTSDGFLGTDNSCSYYLQWDASYLYIGWVGGRTNWHSDTYFAAINRGSGGTSSAVAGVSFTDAMDYYIVYENTGNLYGGNGDAYEVYSGSTGSWVQSTRFDGANNGTDGRITFGDSPSGEVRIRVPWSQLGGSLPADFQIVLWANNSDGSYIWSSWPASNPAGGSTPQTLTKGINFNTSGTVCPATAQIERNLPVVLTSFGAEKTGSSSIRLAWETASEYNNDRFEIERSGDARQWTTIGAVASQDGDSRSALQYTFDDRQPLAGTNYYRLRQVDRDNSSTLSRMVKVAMNTRASISVSPNPVRAGQSVTVAFPDAPEASTVRLYNAYGTLLRTWMISTDQATHELDLSGITPGLLVVECGAQTVKLIKE